MPEAILVDNDVALKACCYEAVDEVIACLATDTRSVCILGVARYVLRDVVSRAGRIVDKPSASKRLSQLLDLVTELEPNGDELALAAELEEAALRSNNADLNTGESQLLSILVHRGALLLLTGDKRAIKAIEAVVHSLNLGEKAGNRVACLEQLMLTLLRHYGADAIHTRVCKEANVDKALAICFKCVSGNYSAESIESSLLSYIADVRKTAKAALIASDDLSAVIS